MEKLIEGLKEYRTLEDIDNPYFMDIEYQVIYNNHPECLLPIQVRTIDGHSRLLYEVTGMCSMETEMSRKAFSREEMAIFLRDFKKLVGELDRLMLDISQICFRPESIFRKKGGHYSWIYTPEKRDQPMKGIERLFEWILTSIDYSDYQLVQYAYYSYWCIRNQPFSEETLQMCLDYQPETITAGQPVSYERCFSEEMEEGNKETVLPEKERAADHQEGRSRVHMGFRDPVDYSAISGVSHTEAGPDDSSFRRFLPEILSGTACGIVFTALVIFLIMGVRQGMLMELKYYIAGIVGVMILACDLLWLFRRRRKKAEKDRKKEVRKRKPAVYPSYDHSWEEEGGTEVLSIRKDMLKPAFRSVDSGKVHVIDVFPFYIGSEAAGNQLVIDEPSVSRRHAAVIRGRQTGNYDLQDLRSTNGTWVDQKPISYEHPVRLEKGNIVRFAKKNYEFIMLDQIY